MAIKQFSINCGTGVITPYSPYKWARIKHLPRSVPELFAPDEIFIQDVPAGTGIGNGVPWRTWWADCRAKNNDAAWEWLTNWESMLFNNDGRGGKIDITKNINARLSDGGGGLMAYDAETDLYIRQVCYKYTDTPRADWNFFNHPEYYWYPTAINEDGNIIRKIGNGIDIFIPRVARTERWIRKSQVVLLPSRPVSWGISDVLSA